MRVPYHRALIGDEEIAEVVATLQSGWLTSGPRVVEFERKFEKLKPGASCIAVNSCTAALFLAQSALNLQPGDEVITTPFTFASTAHTIFQNGGTPVFADIDPETLNLDPKKVEEAITDKTRAIVVVHVAGNPCDMDAFVALAEKHNLALIEDCAHATEGTFRGKPLGTFGFAGAFSFYANKNITTGEGGMLITNDPEKAEWFRLMRKHGLSADTWERQSEHDYRFYDVDVPGFKCNLTDLAAAIGIHQLDRVEEMWQRRKEIRGIYDQAFANLSGLRTIRQNELGESGEHLYILRLTGTDLANRRNKFINALQEAGVSVSVAYSPPVHLLKWYQEKFGYQAGSFPEAEAAANSVFALPFFPDLREEEIEFVIKTVTQLAQSL